MDGPNHHHHRIFISISLGGGGARGREKDSFIFRPGRELPIVVGKYDDDDGVGRRSERGGGGRDEGRGLL